MKRTVSAMEARRRLGELLEGVYYRGDEVVIERAGKVMGVVVPVDEYQRMNAARERVMELVRKNWERNKDVPYEEIQRTVAEAMAEVRGGKPERYMNE